MLDIHYALGGYDFYGDPDGDDLNSIIQTELEVEDKDEIANDIIESLCDQFNEYGDDKNTTMILTIFQSIGVQAT